MAKLDNTSTPLQLAHNTDETHPVSTTEPSADVTADAAQRVMHQLVQREAHAAFRLLSISSLTILLASLSATI